jgi:hypothetical protein
MRRARVMPKRHGGRITWRTCALGAGARRRHGLDVGKKTASARLPPLETGAGEELEADEAPGGAAGSTYRMWSSLISRYNEGSLPVGSAQCDHVILCVSKQASKQASWEDAAKEVDICPTQTVRLTNQRGSKRPRPLRVSRTTKKNNNNEHDAGRKTYHYFELPVLECV